MHIVSSGSYAARILKGERAGELPVDQAAKFELVINSELRRRSELPFPPRCNCSPTR